MTDADTNNAAPSGASGVTGLLKAWRGGNEQALEQLMPLVYQELHRQADRYLRRERPGHMMQATALVNEAFLRLVDCDTIDWQNRAHFFAISAQMMRRILVDMARAQQYSKRGGGARQVSLTAAEGISAGGKTPDLIALDDALNELAALNPRQCRVVELRFFAGLSLEETAEVLQVSVGTVRRDWSLAQAWLFSQLNRETA
ncbi:MAG: sigma-70 family RNA polymerase sigma factor [Blastocatellia bacterium]